MIELLVVGIKYNKWKNKVWKGQVVLIEIERSNIPKYGNRSAVKIYGKVLGLLSKDREKLPVGSSFFANIWTYNNCAKIKLVDKPVDWLAALSDSSKNFFSSDFLNSLDTWDYEDEDDYAGVFLDNNSTPQRFHEWLIREEIDDKVVEEATVRRYQKFIRWLVETHKVAEDEYGDEEITEYRKKCFEEEKLIKA